MLHIPLFSRRLAGSVALFPQVGKRQRRSDDHGGEQLQVVGRQTQPERNAHDKIIDDAADDDKEKDSIGIIGGADGPTAIFLTTKLAPELLGPIAIAAYSYMALIPLIQPPIMKALTTEKMRTVKMEQAREVSKTEKIVFPMAVATFVILLLPSTAPLIGCLMLGNLFRECGVTERLSDTVQNALMNIVTIFLATSVGATMIADSFLNWNTIKIILLGLIAFSISTVGGLLGGIVMYRTSGGEVNPLIGSAGVSAVPMAARVSQDVGRKYNKNNYLLMDVL